MEERRAQVVEFRQPERIRCVQELSVQRELQRLGQQREARLPRLWVASPASTYVRGRSGCTQADAAE
jgi:hypothetical protein